MTKAKIYKSQLAYLVDYLLKHRSITNNIATFELDIPRLAARIYELRMAGYRIETVRYTVTNKYHTKSTYAKYVLIKTPSALRRE